MKLVYPVLALAAGAFAQNAVVTTMQPGSTALPAEPEMTWQEWMAEYVPGFKMTKKYYQFENTDFDIFVKYDHSKNTFEVRTPWFTEEWEAKETDKMWKVAASGTSGESESWKLTMKQGVENRVQKDKKTGEKTLKGTQWIRLFDMKAQDKSMEDGVMAAKQQITTEMNTKDKWTATKFEEKMQYGKMKAEHKMQHFPKYRNGNEWYKGVTKWEAKFDDGMGQKMTQKMLSEAEMTVFEMDEALDTIHMNFDIKTTDENTAIDYNMQTESHVENYSYCDFAMKWAYKAIMPNEMKTTDELFQSFMEEEEFAMLREGMTEDQIRAVAEEVTMMTEADAFGNMVLGKPCMASHAVQYSDSVTQVENSMQFEMMFRNLMDMWVKVDGQEMIKVTNKVEQVDQEDRIKHTVSIYGEEMYTMDHVEFQNKMMESFMMMAQEMYYMYKEHEMYIGELMAEDADWMEIISLVANWDYLATQIKNYEHEQLQAYKNDCSKTEKAKRAEFGVELTAAGERETLKQMDMHIQFMEYIESNQIDLGQYLKDKMCEKAIAMGYADEPSMMEEDANAVMPEPTVYPEYAYVERTSEEIQAAVTAKCEMQMDYMMTKHAEMSQQAIDGFVMYRDQAVTMVTDTLNMVNARAEVEAKIDDEIKLVEDMRAGQWNCEYWAMFHKKMGHTSEEEFYAAMEACNPTAPLPVA